MVKADAPNQTMLDTGNMASRLVQPAQSIVEDGGLYNPNWVWSAPVIAVAQKTGKLTLATLAQMGSMPGEMAGAEFAQASERMLSDPKIVEARTNDRFAAMLMADEAKDIVAEEGLHGQRWVRSLTSLAVGTLAGQLAFGIARSIDRLEDQLDVYEFATAFEEVAVREGGTVRGDLLIDTIKIAKARQARTITAAHQEGITGE